MDYREVKNRLSDIANSFEYTTGLSPFKGVNFMTDSIITRGKFPNGVWFELSAGRGMGDCYIYGVTLRHKDQDLSELQGCFQTFEEVNRRKTC